MLLLLFLACAPRIDAQPCATTFTSGAYTCDLPGWSDRGYHLYVPDGYSADTPVPLVIGIHGGGGNKLSSARETCQDGDPEHPSCMHNELANREGFAVVYPDGHPGKGLLKDKRSWNAGGGEGEWRATGAGAVEADSDDTKFIEDLLDDVGSRMAIDTRRVYALGLSNGGAMSFRLACTLSERITAVAPIGGAMQWTTTHTCEPTRKMPILYTHGEDDPCWVYEGGESECPVGQRGLKHVSAQRTLDEWVQIHGCTGEPVEDALPDTDGDGRVTRRTTYQGCEAPLVHQRIEGGGHTWPDGWQYLNERIVGPIAHDWGDEVFWAFFEQHALPEP